MNNKFFQAFVPSLVSFILYKFQKKRQDTKIGYELEWIIKAHYKKYYYTNEYGVEIKLSCSEKIPLGYIVTFILPKGYNNKFSDLEEILDEHNYGYLHMVEEAKDDKKRRFLVITVLDVKKCNEYIGNESIKGWKIK